MRHAVRLASSFTAAMSLILLALALVLGSGTKSEAQIPGVACNGNVTDAGCVNTGYCYVYGVCTNTYLYDSTGGLTGYVCRCQPKAPPITPMSS